MNYTRGGIVYCGTKQKSSHFFNPPKNTVILSFLKRECQRTVNVFHYSFLGVSDRSALQPFSVPDRLHERC
jgi:hypothetical protein